MNKYLKTFLTAFSFFALAMIVAIIPTKGIWVYYGDFNVQQIPFYIHLHDAIRSGNFLYDWQTDLGGSIVGCYSFYILGSPFFWLTIPFPSAWVPYLIPWVNCLKYAVMATTAFLYIRKHVKTDSAAFIGAMLYTFSGYCGAVLVFNHFHDVLAFFPLYLWTFEEAMENKKKLPFAWMTTLMIVINYYFFVGEFIFLLITFGVRYFDKKAIKETLYRFLRATWCIAAGTAIAGIYILPAVYYTVGNKRLSNVLSGNDLLVYEEPTMILGIIKNAIMLPDISGLNSMFNQGYSRVSGVAAYLPFVSVSCVIAYFLIKDKRDKERKLLSICLLFAAVPFLNALFSALNSEYYARWFYMPILIMALMSARIIEDLDKETYPVFRKGVNFTFILTICLWLCALLPTKTDEGKWTILGTMKNKELLLCEIIFSAVMIIALTVVSYIIVPLMLQKSEEEKNREDSKDTPLEIEDSVKEETDAETEVTEDTSTDAKESRAGLWNYKPYRILMITACCIGCIATTFTMLISGKNLVENERCLYFIEQGIKGKDEMNLSDSRFYRIETEEDIYNYPMIWNRSSITSFISTIPFGTIDFYAGIGVTRKVTSKLHESRLGARTLLSGKYFLVEQEESIPIETIGRVDDPQSLVGYSYVESMNGFDVYKNDYFIPMGFSFDYYITEEDYGNNDAATGSLDKLLLKAIILDDETADKYKEYMEQITAAEIPPLSNHDMQTLSNDLRSRACNSFKTNTYGFKASVDMMRDNLLFFSVPYEDGFKAYVDGVETEIVKADFGFMAVLVSEGSHEVEFRYLPSNITAGFYISIIGIILMLSVAVADYIYIRRNTIREDDEDTDEDMLEEM